MLSRPVVRLFQTFTVRRGGMEGNPRNDQIIGVCTPRRTVG